MRTHVKVLAVLQLVFGAGSLALAAGGGLLFSLLASFVAGSGDQDAEVGAAVLGGLSAVVTTFFAVVGAIQLTCGVGLLNFKPWARILGIIGSAMSLVSVPFGTALGIYGLWVLFSKDTEVLFKVNELAN